MEYEKPRILISSEASMSIQRTDKGTLMLGDMINPNDPNPYMNQPAYEADE
jgi:hypothetical protein